MDFETIQQVFPFIEQHSLWSILSGLNPTTEEIQSGYLDLSKFQIGSGTFVHYGDQCSSHHHHDITHEIMDHLPGDFTVRDLQRVWLILILLAREDRQVWKWCPNVPAEWFEDEECFLAPPYRVMEHIVLKCEVNDDCFFAMN